MAAVIVLGVFWLGVLIAWLWLRRLPDPRMVECMACGQPLPASKAVIIADADDYPDGPGGTAVITEYHRRCAPKQPA